MEVAIAGGHGQVARHLARRLAARGDRVRALIRDLRHADDVREDGAEPVVCDLETSTVAELAEAIAGCDAVVFAAGAGPGSGAARKLTMDRDGAIRLLEAARGAQVDRYVMVSSVGAEAPPGGDDVFSVYLRAKAQADRALEASDRTWTIVRPGALRDGEGLGTVRLTTEAERGEVAREDVAAVLEAVLHEPRTRQLTLYVNAGDDPVASALDTVLSGWAPAGAQPL